MKAEGKIGLPRREKVFYSKRKGKIRERTMKLK